MSKDFTRDAGMEFQKGVECAIRYGSKYAYIMRIQTQSCNAVSFVIQIFALNIQLSFVLMKETP